MKVNKRLLLLVVLFAGCGPVRYTGTDESVLKSYAEAEVLPILEAKTQSPQRDPREMFFTRTISINEETETRLVVGMYRNHPQTNYISLTYSDDKRRRILWQYSNYSFLREVRFSADRMELYYVVERVIRNNMRVLYVYDLAGRQPVGNILLKTQKATQEQRVF